MIDLLGYLRVYPGFWVPNQPISAGLGTYPGFLWVDPGLPMPSVGGSVIPDLFMLVKSNLRNAFIMSCIAFFRHS
jgi:hypothetical protein